MAGRERDRGVLSGWNTGWEDDGEAHIGAATDAVPAQVPGASDAPIGEPRLADTGDTPASGSVGGQDGADIRRDVESGLARLTRIAADLGVGDPVEEFFSPLVGRWSLLHSDAELWRNAAAVTTEVSSSVTGPLGGLDAAWEGADATVFLEYMRTTAQAGDELAEAMRGIATALDTTADGIREIVQELAATLADAAESADQAIAAGEGGRDRARQHLERVRLAAKEFVESVREVLGAFVRMCAELPDAPPVAPIVLPTPAPQPVLPIGDLDLAAQDGSGGTAGSDGGAVPSGIGGGGVGAGGGMTAAPTADPQPLTAGDYSSAEQQPSVRSATGAPAAAAAGAPVAAGTGVGGGMPMMPMGMGGMGAGGGGDAEHRSKNQVVGDPMDIYGQPEKASPSVIGDEDADRR